MVRLKLIVGLRRTSGSQYTDGTAGLSGAQQMRRAPIDAPKCSKRFCLAAGGRAALPEPAATRRRDTAFCRVDGARQSRRMPATVRSTLMCGNERGQRGIMVVVKPNGGLKVYGLPAELEQPMGT